MPNFTRDWFTRFIPTWKLLFSHLREKPITALELGSYEGRSAVWLLNNILHHAESRLICVDPFIRGPGDLEDVEGLEARLRQNLIHYRKATFIKSTSLDYFRTNWDEIDFCYIDANHHPAFVLPDMVHTWERLRKDGFIVVDDYLWLATERTPKPAVDGFVECFREQLEIVEWGYQFVARKLV